MGDTMPGLKGAITAEEISGLKGAYQSTFLADLQKDSDHEEETFLQPGEKISLPFKTGSHFQRFIIKFRNTKDIEDIKKKQSTNRDSFYFEASVEVHNPGVCNLVVEDNRTIGRSVYNISTSLYFDRMDDAISIMVNNNNLPSGGIYNIEPKDYVIKVFGKSNNMISSELRISSPWGNLPTRQSWLDYYHMGLNESRSKELLVALLNAIKACNVSLN